MQAVALLLVVALVSLLITRVATVALTVTGMPRPAARFQARSALSGVGFTTKESESVVNHPVRRRIVMSLMLIGNVGLATAVVGLLGGFLRADAGQSAFRAVLLVAGLGGVYWLSRSAWVDRRLSRLIARFLARHTDLAVRDYDRLLHLSGEYSVKELAVQQGGWLAGRLLGDLRLRDEGIIVLGVTRADGSYLGVPDRDTCLEPGDVLILYGRDSAVAAVSARGTGAAGEADRRRAVATQREVAREEEEAEP